VKYVIGPDGSPLTIADLPPPSTKRWVIRRKAEVVAAVRGGLLSLDEACSRYTLTVDEFLSWQMSIDQFGLAGLRTTRIQQYRQEERAARVAARLCRRPLLPRKRSPIIRLPVRRHSPRKGGVEDLLNLFSPLSAVNRQPGGKLRVEGAASFTTSIRIRGVVHENRHKSDCSRRGDGAGHGVERHARGLADE
jgi:hypothetical protein